MNRLFRPLIVLMVLAVLPVQTILADSVQRPAAHRSTVSGRHDRSLTERAQRSQRSLPELLERLPRPEDKETLRRAKAHLEPMLRRQEKADTRHSYDVLHYEINMDIDIPGDSVRSAAVFIDGAS
jgi:hypothetical protein